VCQCWCIVEPKCGASVQVVVQHGVVVQCWFYSDGVLLGGGKVLCYSDGVLSSGGVVLVLQG
jgi:hypothetical protein